MTTTPPTKEQTTEEKLATAQLAITALAADWDVMLKKLAAAEKGAERASSFCNQKQTERDVARLETKDAEQERGTAVKARDDEAWKHAACLSIAEGAPGYADCVNQSPAMKACIALRQKVDGIEKTSGCLLAGPGRGDCAHFLGLPKTEEHPKDVDEYLKPHGWCWSCWKSEKISRLEKNLAMRENLAKAEGLKAAANRQDDAWNDSTHMVNQKEQAMRMKAIFLDEAAALEAKAKR